MHQSKHASAFVSLEEALTVLFCLVDDIYQNVNPNGRRYESLKKLSDSEVITLALFQQLRGVESQRSFLRDASRFFSHLFPGVVDLVPSSLHRRIRKLRCFLEPLRRAVLSELVGEPETLLIDSTLLEVLHPTFTSTRNGNRDIFVINKDGKGLTRLTTSPQFDSSPAWSPDGTRIAFNKNPSEEPSITKIYVMKAARESETNRPQRLTTSGLGVEEGPPAWSPDGTRIAFSSDQSGDFELYTIRADGSGQIQLTNSSGGGSPAWSPDGTKIVFSRLRGSARMSVGIYVMKAAPESETNRPKWLAGNRLDSFSPDWQPLR